MSKMSSLMLPMQARRTARRWSSNEGGMVPGVSSSSNPAQRIHCLPRVTPALSPVTARLPPLRALMSELLPVLGMPATISLGGRVMPRAASFCNFSRKSPSILPPKSRAVPCAVAMQRTANTPAAAKAERKASVFLSSARSALFSAYSTGFLPNRRAKFLLYVAAGARASSTAMTPSTSASCSSIMRMALVMWPGNHWICFIKK